VNPRLLKSDQDGIEIEHKERLGELCDLLKSDQDGIEIDLEHSELQKSQS